MFENEFFASEINILTISSLLRSMSISKTVPAKTLNTRKFQAYIWKVFYDTILSEIPHKSILQHSLVGCKTSHEKIPQNWEKHRL